MHSNSKFKSNITKLLLTGAVVLLLTSLVTLLNQNAFANDEVSANNDESKFTVTMNLDKDAADIIDPNALIADG